MQLNVNHQWLKANMLFYIIGHQPQTRGVFRLVRPPTAARNFDPASLRGVGHPEGGEIGSLAFSDASWQTLQWFGGSDRSGAFGVSIFYHILHFGSLWGYNSIPHIIFYNNTIILILCYFKYHSMGSCLELLRVYQPSDS